MSSPSLGSIANEILLTIIRRVEFSKENFTALALVNHHFYDLIVGQGSRFLYDIAAIQYPTALLVGHYFQTTLGKEDRTQSLDGLERLATMSHTCDEVLQMFHRIRRGAEVEVLQIRKHMAMTGWEDNLLLGLHISYKMRSMVRVIVAHDESFRDSTYRKGAALLKAFVNSLPPAMCLAIRHTTLGCLDLLKLVDHPAQYGRAVLEQDPDISAQMEFRISTDKNPLYAIEACAFFSRESGIAFKRKGICPGPIHIGEALRKPSGEFWKNGRMVQVLFLTMVAG
jgi:hypothetical protein